MLILYGGGEGGGWARAIFGDSWGSAVWECNTEPILFLLLYESKTTTLPPHIGTHVCIYLPFLPIIQTQRRREGFSAPTTFHQVCTLGSSTARVYKSRFRISDSVHSPGVEDIQDEAGLPRWPWARLHPILPSQPLLTASRGRQETGEQGSRWEAGGAASVAHLLAPLPAPANSSSCTPRR